MWGLISVSMVNGHNGDSCRLKGKFFFFTVNVPPGCIADKPRILQDREANTFRNTILIVRQVDI